MKTAPASTGGRFQEGSMKAPIPLDASSVPATCAFDPPCLSPVIAVLVHCNPLMPDRPACAEHAPPHLWATGLDLKEIA